MMLAKSPKKEEEQLEYELFRINCNYTWQEQVELVSILNTIKSTNYEALDSLSQLKEILQARKKFLTDLYQKHLLESKFITIDDGILEYDGYQSLTFLKTLDTTIPIIKDGKDMTIPFTRKYLELLASQTQDLHTFFTCLDLISRWEQERNNSKTLLSSFSNTKSLSV